MSGKIICSWHEINWNFELVMGDSGTANDTHSICESCAKVLIDSSNIKVETLKEAR